jgi:fimbrial protein FimW
MKTINIIIDDDNRYFSYGLRISIAEYAWNNEKTVCFLASDSKERPDVLFASSTRCAQRWGTPWHAQNVTIEDRKKGSTQEVRRVLYRTDNQSDLFALLERVFANTHFSRVRSIQPLTPREQEVMNYLRRGFGQSQTAKILGISVKTIHSHKRSVMNKLMLKGNRDFIYWLLSQGGGYYQYKNVGE